MFKDFRLGEKWKTLSYKARERYRKQMQTRFLNEMKKAVYEIGQKRREERLQEEEKKKKRELRREIKDLKHYKEKLEENPDDSVYKTLAEASERKIKKLQEEGVTI